MTNKYLLGFDIGSSSVKASLVDAESGRAVATAFFPETEAPIKAVKAGWAEQSPEMWWTNAKLSLSKIMTMAGAKGEDIAAIGIAYQMHGLVCVGKDGRPLRDAIIWCDSRAVPYGQQAFDKLGSDYCLTHLLGSPGNFTAAKLAWVKDNEPEVYERIDKIMLPGDYIAMRLSGEAATTVGGLSEGMFWDFKENKVASELLDCYGFDSKLIPAVTPTFSVQGRVSAAAAAETGLKAGTPVTYRGGDQPNNALSLGVMEPGEIASTAGTSGVVYGILGQANYDPKSRVNTFAHVNHSAAAPRLGVLLCINGTGIQNAWAKRNIAPRELSYNDINTLAATVPVGSEGLTVIPFGNGAERVLCNRETGCSFHNINFNRHTAAHMLRAAQEGIAFSFCYGIEIMKQMGMEISKIHAADANMFFSPIFRDTLAGVSRADIELYDTDGSIGSARGAGIGAGIYASPEEAFATLRQTAVVHPDETQKDRYAEAYARWRDTLEKSLS